MESKAAALLVLSCLLAVLPASAVEPGGALTATAGEARAPRPPRPRPVRPVGDPLRPGVWRFHGTDPNQPMGDLAPLQQLIGKATVVGLGETIHTSGGFYQAKDRVIRYLVSQLGFRVIALETPWAGADELAAYVESCEGGPDVAFHQIFGVWYSEETRDMVNWLCDWNRAHPRPADKVHFMGFDIQDVYGQTRADASGLRAFLARIGIGEGDPRNSGLDQCQGVVRTERPVPPSRYDACSSTLQALDDHFREREEEIGALTSKSDLAWARLFLSDLRAWEDQSLHETNTRSAAFTARDRGMAYALLALRSLRYPGAKTVVWAHNSHLSEANTIETFRGAQSMGSFLRQALGPDYLTIALASQQTDVDWGRVLCGHRTAIGTPGSVEGILHGLEAGDLLVDLHHPGLIPGLLPAGPLKMGFDRLLIDRDFDLLLYLDHSPRMRPLLFAPCG